MAPDDDVFTALAHRPLVTAKGRAKALLGGVFCVQDRWPTLEALILAGVDLRDMFQWHYSLEDLLLFPDCCFGRLLEMGLHISMFFEYQAYLPMQGTVLMFGITPERLVHDLGFEVRQLNNDDFSIEVAYRYGIRADHLFVGDLLLWFDDWEALRDPHKLKDRMEWSSMQAATLACYRAYRSGAPIPEASVKLIWDVDDQTLTERLRLPHPFIKYLASTLTKGFVETATPTERRRIKRR